MDEQVKICPRCRAEYFARVAECKGCGVALVCPGDLSNEDSVPPARGPLVCVEEGDYEKVKDLAAALEGTGVETQVLKAGRANSCSSASAFGIFVPESQARYAARALASIWDAMYPELKESEDRLLNGQCPACGADISSGPKECPDCGLNLDGGCAPDDGCGGCGH